MKRICQKSHITNEVHQRTNGLIFTATKASRHYDVKYDMELLHYFGR